MVTKGGDPHCRLRELAEATGRRQLIDHGVTPLGEIVGAPCPPEADSMPALRDRALWTAGASRLSTLLALTGEADATRAVEQVGVGPAALLTTLATPTELLLMLGGDDRQIPSDGRNSYALPGYDLAPVAPLSSCTASVTDAVALTTACDWQEWAAGVVAEQPLGTAVDTLRAAAVQDVLEAVHLPAEFADRVALTPSGTDAETLISAIVLAATSRRVCNILVGSAEAGSGTPRAAAGRRFLSSAAFAHGLEAGDPVEGLDVDRLDVVDVDVRDANGRMRRAFDVEAEIEAHLEDALDRDMVVVVHVMAGSKTGLVQPSLMWVREWTARERLRLRVVVDAAQVRTSPEMLREYLAAGASLIVSGSKSLSAPPFCGAVVLGLDMCADAARAPRLADGLRASYAAADLPAMLRSTLSGLEPVNAGLLARWRVAGEHRRRSTALGTARDVAAAFLITACRRAIASHPRLHLLAAPGADATIVSFMVNVDGGVLGKADLAAIHRTMASEGGVYVGQPVEIVRGGAAALRLAVGSAVSNHIAAADDARRRADAMVDATIERLDAVLRDLAPTAVCPMPAIVTAGATATHR